MLRTTVVTMLAALLLALTAVAYAQDEATETPVIAAVESGYAAVNGLEMYYEIHGAGEPLLMLHGGYASIDLMAPMIAPLAADRQVVAVELQGHGRTADIDQPLSYEQMADDVAALLAEIGIAQTDVYGYSLGGGVALQLAIRHPQVVDQLIVASMPYSSEGYHAGMMDMFGMITPEMFAGTPMETEYARLSPNPDGFATLVQKLATLDSQPMDWSDNVAAIEAPTLLIFGDADVITLTHAVEMFGLLGGGVNGDMGEVSNARLAIVPNTTHVGLMFRNDWLVSMMTEFLDGTSPMPAM